MGADSTAVYYGIRIVFPNSDSAQMEELSSRRHPLQAIARAARLQIRWGRLTDGSDYHVLIGKEIGIFGSENESHRQLPTRMLLDLMNDVDKALATTELQGPAALHFQLEADY